MVFLPGCSCCGGGGGSERVCIVPDTCSYSINIKQPASFTFPVEFAGCNQLVGDSDFFMPPEYPLSLSGWTDDEDALAPCVIPPGSFDSTSGRFFSVFGPGLNQYGQGLLQAYAVHRGGLGKCKPSSLPWALPDAHVLDQLYWGVSCSIGIAPFNPNDASDKWKVDITFETSALAYCYDEYDNSTTSYWNQIKRFTGNLPCDCIDAPNRTCQVWNGPFDSCHIQAPLSIQVSNDTTSLGDWTSVDSANPEFGGVCDDDFVTAINHAFGAEFEFEVISRNDCNPAP